MRNTGRISTGTHDHDRARVCRGTRRAAGGTVCGRAVAEDREGQAGRMVSGGRSQRHLRRRDRQDCFSSPAIRPIRLCAKCTDDRKDAPWLGHLLHPRHEARRIEIRERQRARSARRQDLQGQDDAQPRRADADDARLSRHLAVRQGRDLDPPAGHGDGAGRSRDRRKISAGACRGDEATAGARNGSRSAKKDDRRPRRRHAR